jgi:spermidine synthase
MTDSPPSAATSSPMTGTVTGTVTGPGAGLRPWLYVTVFASGIAGLGYEMAWSRMLSVALGHEIVAVLAVLAAFFAGLALGALLLGDRIHASARPGLWYVWLELAIGAWALALIWLIPWFNATLPALIGETPTPLWHWTLSFSATLVLLLPATAAMGATLPALERLYRQALGDSRHVGGVYAANTLGAVVGTLTAVFVLVPWLGHAATLALLALVNLGCAISILLLQRRLQPAPSMQPMRSVPPAAAPKAVPQISNRRLVSTLFLTGLLGLAYEVLVIRVLSQVLEDTVYTFAIVLAVYLLGTALGAALYQWRFGRRPAGQGLLADLLLLAAATCLAGTGVLWLADVLYDGFIAVTGISVVTAVFAEVSLALLVFLLPTLVMGALFSHLAQDATARFGLGRALGVNMLGAMLAPVLAGILLLPAVGAQAALVGVSAAYLLLLPGLGRRRWLPALVPVGLAVVLALLPPLRFVSVPPGGSVLDYREGVMASVSVVEDAVGTRYLKVNNHFSMGSTSSRFADHRQTHIPLLLHPDPRSALFLGIGTGMTLNAAQYHPDLAVTAVDLVPETLDLMHYFGTDPRQNDWQTPPRLLASDARRFVVSTQEQFDVVIADLFHPSRDGAGALYTREHFDAIGRRLAPGGQFWQWLPLFQMDLETLALIAHTFAQSFPHVQVHLPHFSLHQPIVGLVGSHEPLAYRPDLLIERVRSLPLQRELVELRLNADLALFGGYLGDRDTIEALAGSGSINTDDHTLVTFRAPAFAYRREEGHAERLVDLVQATAARRGTLLAGPATPAEQAFAQRMEAYWQARDAYLRAGIGIDPEDDLLTMLEKTRDPLLDVLRISSDFTPAYGPLLAMAESLASLDRPAARRLLSDLDRVVPDRPDARRLLGALGRAPTEP